MSTVGVDLGATFIKSARLDLETTSLRDLVQTPSPPFSQNSDPRVREADPELFVRIVEDHLISHSKKESVKSVFFCGQMHGLVLLDSQGKVGSHFISWQDQRGANSLPGSVVARFGTETGNELRAGAAATHLVWMKNQGENLKGCVPLTLPEFVQYRLSGELFPSEPTLACGQGVYDVRKGDWHQGLLAELSLSDLRWPRISSFVNGGGRWKGADLYPAVGDQPCALLGTGLQKDEISINVGTGAQVGVLCEDFRKMGDTVQLRPYFNDMFLMTATRLSGGRRLKALLGHQDWDQAGLLLQSTFEEMAEEYYLQSQKLPNASQMVFSGGAIRKLPKLRQAIEERFGLPSRMGKTEETLEGLLALAQQVRC